MLAILCLVYNNGVKPSRKKIFFEDLINPVGNNISED
nr:MAG TPA: hypothetical protein [Caudoviricetes sp.]